MYYFLNNGCIKSSNENSIQDEFIGKKKISELGFKIKIKDIRRTRLREDALLFEN